MLEMLLYDWRINHSEATCAIHKKEKIKIEDKAAPLDVVCTWLARVIPSVVRQYGYIKEKKKTCFVSVGLIQPDLTRRRSGGVSCEVVIVISKDCSVLRPLT